MQGSGAGKHVMSGVSPSPCEACARVSVLPSEPGQASWTPQVSRPGCAPPPPSRRLCAAPGSCTCHPPICLPGTLLITQLPGTSEDGEGNVFVINGGLLLPCPPPPHPPKVAGYSHLHTEARGPLLGPVFRKLGTYI